MTDVVDPRLTILQEMQQQAELGGGQARIDRQHAQGKMTARERLVELLDAGSFHELQPFTVAHPEDEDAVLGDGVVTGYGTVAGRRVLVYSQDFTVYGGSVSLVHARKIVQVQELALNNGCPIVGLLDSGGARIQEGVMSLQGYGEVFRQNALSSGVVPQISVIMGPCAGGASYSPALTDFVVMVDKSSMMFITGPDVVKSVTGEEVDHEGLGGAQVHAGVSGVAHFIGRDEAHALTLVRHLLSYLPSNNVAAPLALPPEDDPERLAPELNSIVPVEPNLPYDMLEVIQAVVDRTSWFEVHAAWAQNAIVGFARLNGRPIGVVAQQPLVLAGSIDIDASDKISRFVRFCDAFNLPIVTFADSPGFLPGVGQEHNGIIRHGAKIIYAYVEATVPKVSVVTRKGYGGAYIVMGSKSLGADVHVAWPTAEIAVMGPEGAVSVINRRELAAAEDPDAVRAELVAQYRETYANPYYSARRGIVDGVIEPARTRPELIAALETLQEQIRSVPPKKHGIMPA